MQGSCLTGTLKRKLHDYDWCFLFDYNDIVVDNTKKFITINGTWAIFATNFIVYYQKIYNDTEYPEGAVYLFNASHSEPVAMDRSFSVDIPIDNYSIGSHSIYFSNYADYITRVNGTEHHNRNHISPFIFTFTIIEKKKASIKKASIKIRCKKEFSNNLILVVQFII